MANKHARKSPLNPQRRTLIRRGRASRFSLAVLFMGCGALLSNLVLSPRAAALFPPPDAKIPSAGASAAQGGDYSVFSHTTAMHARLPCLICHRREDARPRPKLPGHMPCAGCHAQQFSSTSGAICTICHESPPAAALKPFPPLKTFGARFDHAKHLDKASCATCHRPVQRGVALSIPSASSAHSTCYQCHGPRAQGTTRGDISSCGTCHQQGRLVRTPVLVRAYRISFSHARHGLRQKLNCNSCHQVRSGFPQGQQVSAPALAQHFGASRAQSCMTCHNGKRAFGGDLTLECKRCHQGSAFGF